jgi:hypothetical protein
MIVNFRIYEINQGTRKLDRTSTLIKKNLSDCLLKHKIKNKSKQGGKDVSNSLQLMQTVDIPTLVEHIQGA